MPISTVQITATRVLCSYKSSFLLDSISAITTKLHSASIMLLWQMQNAPFVVGKFNHFPSGSFSARNSSYSSSSFFCTSSVVRVRSLKAKLQRVFRLWANLLRIIHRKVQVSLGILHACFLFRKNGLRIFLTAGLRARSFLFHNFFVGWPKVHLLSSRAIVFFLVYALLPWDDLLRRTGLVPLRQL